MSTRNERSKKRKADEISDEEAPPPPHLPASCLGAILNFLPYSDVRKCMLVGRAMAVGAARHVEVLSIDKAAGMDVPALRRFPSATTLKVVCLVELLDDGPEIAHKLNAGVAAKIVPLVASLTQLRKVWFGGYTCKSGKFGRLVLGGYKSGMFGGLVLYRHYRRGNEEVQLSRAEKADRDVVYRNIIESLGAAFESRAIRQDLKIAGISLMHKVKCSRTEDQQNNESRQVCRTCSRFCRNFPFDNVLELSCYGESLNDRDWNLCVGREEMCRIIKSRPGGNDALKSKTAGIFMLRMIAGFIERWTSTKRNDLSHKVTVRLIEEVLLEDLETMVSWGYSFSNITYSDVLQELPCLSKPEEIRIQKEGSKEVQKHTLRNTWESRNDIERLVKLGLPIEADWFRYEAYPNIRALYED